MSKKSEIYIPGSQNTLRSTYDATTRSGSVTQDIEPFVKQAERERSEQSNGFKGTQDHVRKFATIPSVVAFDIEKNHGISLYDADVFHDDEKKAKLLQIIRTEYPHLVVNS